MPPRPLLIPAEQQRIQSTRSIMTAGQDTARYSAQLMAASFAAVGGQGQPPSSVLPEPE